MSFFGMNVIRIASNGKLRIPISNKLSTFLSVSSSKFSTSNQCIQQSSLNDFLLRHQTSSSKDSNSKWYSYRLASVGLLGGLTACFLCPGNIFVDYITVTLLVHHNHFGIKSVIADYAPLFFKDGLVRKMMFSWLLVSIITLALFYNYNYNNIGFSNALVKLFKL